MLKFYIYLFIFSILLVNCKNSGRENEIVAKKISALHQKFIKNPSDSNFVYLKQSNRLIEQAQEIPDSLKAEKNYLYGLYYFNKEKTDSATHYFYLATEYVKDSIKNRKEMNYFFQAWQTLLLQEKYGDGIAMTDRLLTLLDEKKDSGWVALAHNFHENLYIRTKNYTKALESNDLRLKVLEKIRDTNKIITSQLVRARVYRYQNNKTKYETIMTELLSKEKNLNNDSKRNINSEYGVFHFNEERYKEALKYFLKHLYYSKKTPDVLVKKTMLAVPYTNIAEAYIELGDYEKARKYIDSVKFLGFENIGDRIKKTILKHELHLAYATEKTFDKVSVYIDSIFDDKDKLYVEKFNKELITLKKATKENEFLLKEKQATDIKNLKIKTGLTLASISLLLLSIIGFLFYKKRRTDFDKQSLQLKQRLLRSQMNPHFASNALQTVQYLVKEDKESAIDYLSKFSKHLRIILENSTKDYVELNQELESLEKYLELQLIRFPDKFDYRINKHNLDIDHLVFIPPMLLQPLVENCIEHGFFGVNYKGLIQIDLTRKGKYIECVIEDNGIGLKKNTNSNKKTTSTKLITDFINKTTKSKIEFINKVDIDENSTGALIKLLIPFKLTEND